MHSIQVGVQSWAVDNNDAYPDEGQVAAGGAVAADLDQWPGNPFQPAGTDMADADASTNGDFNYEAVVVGGVNTDYTLLGWCDGPDFVVR